MNTGSVSAARAHQGAVSLWSYLRRHPLHLNDIPLYTALTVAAVGTGFASEAAAAALSAAVR